MRAPEIKEKIFCAQYPEGRLHANASLLIFLACILAILTTAHQYLEQRFDFGVFYYAAHMVLDGSRHALYDLNAQHAFQALFHRPPDTLFRNPPIALLPILPFAKLPMAAAFALWTTISFALLFFSMKTLQDATGICYGNWPVLLSLAFAPVLSNFLHGQFSLIIVAAYAGTYALWRRGRLFLGGLVLAIATIKFQAVIGFVLILIIRRKSKELAGFFTGSAAMLAISLWMVGARALIAYPHFVLHSDTPLSELPHMANWQGFLAIVGLDDPACLIALSLATIIYAASVWKDLDHGFAVATLAAMLSSFHLTPQDLSLCIVPFYLAMRIGAIPRARVAAFTMFSIMGMLTLVVIHAPLAFLALPLSLAIYWIGSDPASHIAETRPQTARYSQPALSR
ncbi:MAG TPA: glycosyltransferase family 87 protein [Terracidiphilus sp.]|nr:glycosyltransferase family 87 protein [Terracidiphilus sp.]